MKQSFLLAWRALVRGHVLTLLLVATALAHLLLPALVRSDGTAEGWREMFVRAVPGTTYAFTVIALLACACGFFAQERERFRLSLTVVRPASAVGVAFGKWFALCLVGVLVYSFTAALTLVRVSDPPPCMHHFAPTLPPPVEKAREMMDEYLANPKTPEFVKKAPRSAVLRLLTNKELDRYDVVRSGKSISWPFDASLANATNMLVRVRFATQFDLRSPLEGEFTLSDFSAVVSNKTQSVVNVPLKRGEKVGTGERGDGLILKFTNTGRELVMLRPRRDLEVLVPADSFGMNLARAVVQMLVVTALLSAFGLFLSSAFSRTVSIFTSLVTMAVALMAPSVVVQFPDEIETTLSNKIGLIISRTVYAFTSTAGEMAPISALATDSCIEWNELLRCILISGMLLPLLFLVLAALIVRRKPLADHS